MMSRSLRLALVSSLLLAACGDDDAPSDGDVVDRDSSGGDVAPIDAGDAGLDTGDDDVDPSDAEADTAPDADAGSDAAADADASADADVDPDANPDVTPDVDPDADPDVSPDVDADTDADVTPDVIPDTTPDVDASPDTTVDWCRLHFPPSIETGLGATVTFYARVYEEGLTDRTTGTDTDAALLAEVGYGADGSTPGGDWTWRDALGNTGWDDAAEPGNDEYIGEWTTDEAGTFDVAFRFSLDDGATWLYCDQGAGVGADGAENGYQPENAAELIVVDVCADACGEVPASECVDGATVRTFEGPGACTPDGLTPRCEFDSVETPCDEGQVCRAGACEADIPRVDWCRLQFPLSLRGIPGDDAEIYARVYEPGVTDLSISNDDPDSLLTVELGYGPDGTDADDTWTWQAAAPNAGYVASEEPDNDEYAALLTFPDTGAWDYAFRATLDGTTWTYCDGPGGVGADGAENGYQPENAGQLTVEPAPDGCEPNPCTTPPPSVCSDETTLEVFASEGTCDASGDEVSCSYDSLLQACDEGDVCRDGACVAESYEIGWCRIQFPLNHVLLEGDTVTYYGRVYIEGLTDRSTGVDADPAVRAQLGLGTFVDEPTTEAWTWFDATPNTFWDGSTVSESDNDEYEVTIGYDDAPYAFGATAFRFSGDSGETWTYCDANAGPGSDGAEDGFQLANTGALTLGFEDCDPNPCVEDVVRFCDGPIVTETGGTGSCLEVGDGFVCEYPTSPIENCADSGATCVDGACEMVMVDPCDDAYACAVPPAPFCEGSVATRVEEVGLCVDADGEADCTFTEVTEDCADTGATCEGGACLTVAAVEPTFCRLQFPLSTTLAAGESQDHFVRFYAEGLTDTTSTTDPYPAVRVQVGVGIDRDPTLGPLAWRWVDAVPNEGYDGASFGEPNNDEYQAAVPFPDEGVYRTAARVSGDGGATWLYCDGQDAGSSNGVSVDDLGVVTVEAAVE